MIHLHDYYSIPSLKKYFDKVVEESDMWDIVEEANGSLVLVLQRKGDK